jgi:hypothetical protein
MHDFVSVAIATPAGLAKKEDTKVRILDDLSIMSLMPECPIYFWILVLSIAIGTGWV